jgi:hypothetical protein
MTDKQWEDISFIITGWLQNLKNKYRRIRTLAAIFAGSANDTPEQQSNVPFSLNFSNWNN